MTLVLAVLYLIALFRLENFAEMVRHARIGAALNGGTLVVRPVRTALPVTVDAPPRCQCATGSTA